MCPGGGFPPTQALGQRARRPENLRFSPLKEQKGQARRLPYRPVTSSPACRSTALATRMSLLRYQVALLCRFPAVIRVVRLLLSCLCGASVLPLRCRSMVVHPTVDIRFRALPVQPAPARLAAAQQDQCLPLLPSGPDGVKHGRFARDPAFNTTYAGQTPQAHTSSGEFGPAMADCRFRVPPVPRLARP